MIDFDLNALYFFKVKILIIQISEIINSIIEAIAVHNYKLHLTIGWTDKFVWIIHLKILLNLNYINHLLSVQFNKSLEMWHVFYELKIR